jgi:hypothetical protein
LTGLLPGEKEDPQVGQGEEDDEEEHLVASFSYNPAGNGPLEPEALQDVADHDQ